MSLYRATIKKVIHEDIYVAAKNAKEAREYMENSSEWKEMHEDFKFDSLRLVDRAHDVPEEFHSGETVCFSPNGNDDITAWGALYNVTFDAPDNCTDDELEAISDEYNKKLEKARKRFFREIEKYNQLLESYSRSKVEND